MWDYHIKVDKDNWMSERQDDISSLSYKRGFRDARAGGHVAFQRTTTTR